MLCPHCGRTIAEQDEYLMSARVRGDEIEWKPWMTYAVCFLLFLILTGVLVMLRHAGADVLTFG